MTLARTILAEKPALSIRELALEIARRQGDPTLRKLTTKYAFYYPENDEQFLGMPEYDSVEEALEAWQDRRSSWEVIPAKGKNLAAFLNSRTGDIVALREKE